MKTPTQVTMNFQAVSLPDNRLLAYAEYGDREGFPLFFFHGIPGSRLFRPAEEITRQMGIRLICTDRPGYGQSSFQPKRRLLDWPADVAFLADSLGIERFAVAGHSGGGPYALACAYALPQRVTLAAVISGLGPIEAPQALQGMWARNRLGLRLGRFIPWPFWRLLIWLFFHKEANERRAAEDTGHKGSSQRPRADAGLWKDPAIRAVCYQSEAEAFRHGTLGHAWETRLITRPWGFPIEAIRTPVHLWHGGADNLAPIHMARFLAARIPNAFLHFYPDEAHLLLFPRWAEILHICRQQEV